MTTPAASTAASAVPIASAAALSHATPLSAAASQASAVQFAGRPPQVLTACTVQCTPGWFEAGSLSWDIVKTLPGALIPALVAVAVWKVSVDQYRVARAKFNFDLFDRRYKNYLLLWEFMSWRVWHVEPNSDLHTDLQNAAPGFRFLFGPEIYDYVQLALSSAVELDSARWTVNALALYDPDGQRAEALETSRRLTLWFEQEAKDLAERFAHYLDFSAWSSRGDRAGGAR